MNPINKAISAIKKYQNPASPLELEPAVITDSPSGRGRIKMLRKQYKDSKKQRRALTKELKSYDYITDQQTVDDFIKRIHELSSVQNIKKQLKQAKDDYRSKNFLGIGDGSGNALPSQLYRYWSRHFGHQKRQDPTFSNRGTDIIDLSQNTIRVTPESKQSTALFNEFVENKNPSVRKASEYQSGQVKVFGDRFNIPTSNISLYAGIEDGKFKVDSLKAFKPETTIVPVRNVKQDTPKIHSINIAENAPKLDNVGLYARLRSKMPEDRYMVTDLTLGYPESNPDLHSEFRDHANFLLQNNAPLSNRERRMMQRVINRKRVPFPFELNRFFSSVAATEIPNGTVKTVDGTQIDEYLQHDKNGASYTFTDSEGNEHPITDYNAAILDNKMVLGNPEGGVFIGKIQNISPAQKDSLNVYLKKNPSWLARFDLGSFDQYRLDNPTAEEYLKQYFEHPKEDDPNVYIVGTTTPNKLW